MQAYLPVLFVVILFLAGALVTSELLFARSKGRNGLQSRDGGDGDQQMPLRD
ncbi:MAG: hypothetical protein LC648_08555 [Novosphingobium sp.]|nr:hypothetical protein [Novosphingobium sp.]